MKYRPGDIIRLISDRNGSYPMVVEDTDGGFVNVVYFAIDKKTGKAELKKGRLRETSIKIHEDTLGKSDENTLRKSDDEDGEGVKESADGMSGDEVGNPSPNPQEEDK